MSACLIFVTGLGISGSLPWLHYYTLKFYTWPQLLVLFQTSEVLASRTTILASLKRCLWGWGSFKPGTPGSLQTLFLLPEIPEGFKSFFYKPPRGSNFLISIPFPPELSFSLAAPAGSPICSLGVMIFCPDQMPVLSGCFQVENVWYAGLGGGLWTHRVAFLKALSAYYHSSLLFTHIPTFFLAWGRSRGINPHLHWEK